MEDIEHNGTVGNLIENTGNKILKVWNAIRENVSTKNIVILAILSISSLTYASLFSETNFIKSDLKNRITDECNA